MLQLTKIVDIKMQCLHYTLVHREHNGNAHQYRSSSAFKIASVFVYFLFALLSHSLTLNFLIFLHRPQELATLAAMLFRLYEKLKRNYYRVL